MISLTDFTRAAKLRASGYSWAAIAREFGVSESTIVRRTKKHPERWGKLLAEAERTLMKESAAEAVVQLRSDLRSKEGKDRRDAAAKLLRFSQQTERNVKPTVHDATSLPATAFRLADYVHTLSDEQLDRLLIELDAARKEIDSAPKP